MHKAERFSGYVIAAIGFLIMVICMGAAFAGDGFIGDAVQGLLAKYLPNNPELSVAIFGFIITLVGAGVRVILKKIPGAGAGIVWKIAAVLFGDGVIMENNTDRNFVKTQLMKKYPWIADITEKPPEVVANENANKMAAAVNAGDVHTVSGMVNDVLPKNG